MLTVTAVFAVLVLAWGSPFQRALPAALSWAGKLAEMARAHARSAAKMNTRSGARKG